MEIRANGGGQRDEGRGDYCQMSFLGLKRLPKLVCSFCTQKPEIHAKSYKRPEEVL